MFDPFDDPFGTRPAEPDYPFLRRALAERYRKASAPAVERVVESSLGGAEADAIEDWLQSLGAIAQAILPIAAGALGTVVGGPVGAAVGGALGGAAAGAIGGRTGSAGQKSDGRASRRPRRRRPRGPHARVRAAIKAAPSPTAPATRAAPAGCPPAAALVGLLAQPQFHQALAALALGDAGASHVNLGQTSVPVTAIASLLGWLADQAAAQQAIWPGADQQVPAYLLDEQGAPRGDISLPEDRARVLLALFHEQAEAALEAREASDFEADAVEEMALLAFTGSNPYV